MATDTATWSNAVVLGSRAEGWARSCAGPASVNLSSKIASLRRIYWNLAVWLMGLQYCPAPVHPVPGRVPSH
jgi:hypothetical protein